MLVLYSAQEQWLPLEICKETKIISHGKREYSWLMNAVHGVIVSKIRSWSCIIIIMIMCIHDLCRITGQSLASWGCIMIRL